MGAVKYNHVRKKDVGCNHKGGMGRGREMDAWMDEWHTSFLDKTWVY
jgi:hypothetical protein